MGFHVSFDALDELNWTIASQSDTWCTALESFQSKIANLVASTNMSGTGADSLKLYLDSVHNMLVPMIGQLITAHRNNFLLYVNDYQSNIDTGLHAIIDEEELRFIERSLSNCISEADTINDIVQHSLDSVSDLCWIGCPGFDSVQDKHDEIDRLNRSLRTSVHDLEDKHYQQDFALTENLTASIWAFINERLGDSRAFKTDFNIEAISNSEVLSSLVQAFFAVNDNIRDNCTAVQFAIENQERRMEELQLEEREEQAKWEKIAVTGVCIVGSIAAIAAIAVSGGTATPLVVGAVSAVSGAVIAGNNAAADEYVEHGWKTSEWDWEGVGKNALIGGVSGFVTGYVGAGIGGTITEYLGKTALASTLLNSSSVGVRLGGAALIGSTSEMFSGVFSRGASSFAVNMIMSEGDFGESVNSALGAAFDGSQILFDAVTGGFVNSFNEYKQYKSDMAVRRFNEKNNPQLHAAERGYELKTSSKNGTLEYSGTDHIMKSLDGSEVIIEIEATGSRKSDFKAAWEKAYEEFGITPDDYSVKVTWQHMDNYRVRTNKMTLELVDTNAHLGIKHAGACKQWEVFTGLKYKP